jgi:DNA-binding MarR family transcriptional regulator
MPRAAAKKIALTVTQAACLRALRKGPCGKTEIAVEAKRDLRTVATALAALGQAGLVVRADKLLWRATAHGQSCGVRVVRDPERRLGGKGFGRLIAGSTAQRLLDALDRPMTGRELVERLGVTKQRVHELVVRLCAQGRLKLGDRTKVLHIVARSGDRSVLLTRDEERALSRFPDEDTTSAAKLATRTHMPAERLKNTLVGLREKGLVEKVGSRRDRVLYRLRTAGREHFQRRAATRRAEPIALPVRSDRVRSVLSYVGRRNGARIREVRDALGISHASMNALMQYLKRKRLVRKCGRSLAAPCELSVEGRNVLSEMIRRGG